MRLKKKTVIMGGGPAGMAAAICAAKKCGGEQVILLEKNKILGRKLLATGNGRCNMTNLSCENAEMVLSFFSDLGILHRVEGEGRVYPYTEQAASVQEAMEDEVERLEVTVLKETAVLPGNVAKRDGEFLVKAESNMNSGHAIELLTENLIIASGGKAGPQYGSDGDGYEVAKLFGHSVVKPIPSLVQVTCRGNFLKNLKGVRAKGTASLAVNRDGKFEILGSEKGEIQFTEDGLSGICIFNLSRDIRTSDRVDFNHYRILLDLMPEFSENDIMAIFERRAEVTGKSDLSLLLRGMLNKKLIPVISRECDGDYKRGAAMIKNWEFIVSGTRGFKEAQVTSGGVPLDQLNLNTMESKITSGLYFAGEVADYDGRCGGYNLQWAFETGIRAGGSINV